MQKRNLRGFKKQRLGIPREYYKEKEEERMILLDYRDKRPIYEQVVEKLERLIAKKNHKADFPSLSYISHESFHHLIRLSLPILRQFRIVSIAF